MGFTVDDSVRVGKSVEQKLAQPAVTHHRTSGGSDHLVSHYQYYIVVISFSRYCDTLRSKYSGYKSLTNQMFFVYLATDRCSIVGVHRAAKACRFALIAFSVNVSRSRPGLFACKRLCHSCRSCDVSNFIMDQRTRYVTTTEDVVLYCPL